MIGSLNAGASGVKSHSSAMTVTGSNIANANTVGFKSHRAQFEDMFASSFGTARGDFGQGSKIRDVTNLFTQGVFESTALATDVALDGDGFLVVQDPKTDKTLYTRAGDMMYDEEGVLVTRAGQKVMVKDVDPNTGASVGLVKEINILKNADPPRATGDGVAPNSGVRIQANLSAEDDIPQVPVNLDAMEESMYNFSTTVKVYDELGIEQVITVAFRKLPDAPDQTDPQTGQIIPGTAQRNQWSWYALAPGEKLKDGELGTMQATGGGYLQFSEDGRFMHHIAAEIQQPTAPPPPPPANAAPNQPPPPPQLLPKTLVKITGEPAEGNPQVAFDFNSSDNPLLVGLNFGMGYNPSDPNDQRAGLDGMTQFSGKNTIKSINADGNPGGSLDSIEIETDGTIMGVYDSGFTRAIGRIMVADFASPEGLENKGGNLFAETYTSGRPFIGDPGRAGRAQLRSYNLEKSNVSLANEFVDMIEHQRGFQANAKTVTTSDEMLMDLVQLKR